MHPLSASGPTTLYHKNRVRIERVRGFSHLVPALILLGGLSGLLGGTESLTPLLGLELAVGAAYVLLLLRELRQLRQHGPGHHERVAWLELAAAGILALEGYHIWHRHHETALRTGEHRLHVLPWLYWAVAVWYGFMAFGMAQLHKRRHLHLHAGGFSGRLHPFWRGFAFRWDEVARVEPAGETDVVVHRTDGSQQRLSFGSVHEGAAHRNRLLAHAAGMGGGTES
ncbi:hypothetical protein SAMN02745146_3580 [Hymenobacter daecheongensis DSM 21074]|uniref:PH domain-containing protein n=1 Tax=Hymenobacter daecheongensis DSM 21074 TaxID=1121955 RepID=A0A1M6KVR8_9BACT|nr:hypothetical protein [Hymenobacter daecheongensis]SHJ62983.1 hypothetical protein SAMN02745146_3580 [Hymenobacter daecheongensis DSM 21074]